MGREYQEACCRCKTGCSVTHSHPDIHSGIHPVGMVLPDGFVIWWGMREPRVPQIMCKSCVLEMEASGEFNRP